MRNLVVAFMLTLALPVVAQSKTKSDYTATYNQELDKLNTVLAHYGQIDCSDADFNKAVDALQAETKAFSDLVENIPDNLDATTKLHMSEDAYGVLYFVKLFVKEQNECVDNLQKQKPSKDKNLDEGN